MNLESKIEAYLFFKGEPVSYKKLAEAFSVSLENIQEAVQSLQKQKEGTGLVLVTTGDEVTLGTSPEANSFLESLRKEELTKDLSKAALETLSVIIYKREQGVTRSEIDYIRGVNSSFILRNLMIRGLVEKKTSASDNRRMIYLPTIELLEWLGATDITQLPRYNEVISEIEQALQTKTEEETAHDERA